MIEDVSDDKEGQMALQRAVEKHQSKQKKKENENNGQKTILGKDEKTDQRKQEKAVKQVEYILTQSHCLNEKQFKVLYNNCKETYGNLPLRRCFGNF